MQNRQKDIVGRLWAEERLPGGRSAQLPEWLLTTEDQKISESLARLYAGKDHNPRQHGTSFGRTLESETIGVNIDSAACVMSRMLLADGQGVVHICDGSNFLAPMANAGSHCGCPDGPFERKAAARSGSGPLPDIQLTCRLAAAPELGLFSFLSSSWEFARSLGSTCRATAWSGEPAEFQLHLKKRRIITRSGMDVSITYPIVKTIRELPKIKSDFRLTA